MKIHIAICDDEENQLLYLRKTVTDWAQSEKHAIVISVFESAEAFMFAFEDDKSFDILLLDIQMKALDGITLAKHLRRLGSQAHIIFVTGYPDFIGEGYEVSALHYLMKPVSEKKLREVLNKACEKLSRQEGFILIETADGPAKLPHRDIICVEAFAHCVIIQTTKGRYEAKISIGALQEKLDDAFFRCHRSYIVGLRHVQQITKGDIIMESGMSIPLSRRLYRAANLSFINFYKGNLS